VDALAKAECVVVVDLLEGPLTEAAHVVLPGLSSFEKDGTMTNDQGRVQRFHAAVPGIGNARPHWRILSELVQVLGGPPLVSGAAEVTDRIAETVAGYDGLTWKAIGKLGRPKGSGAPATAAAGAKEEV
jgi:predicted molibdopterin-dependent oxidoreductase YjgC